MWFSLLQILSNHIQQSQSYCVAHTIEVSQSTQKLITSINQSKMATTILQTKAQVDALAARHSRDGSTTQLVIATSTLEGNRWGGEVLLLDTNHTTPSATLQLDCGVSALAWVPTLEREMLVLACDNGDLEVVTLQLDGSFAAQRSLAAHDSLATSVSAAQDATIVASGGWDRLYVEERGIERIIMNGTRH
jgi:hypothetical protein